MKDEIEILFSLLKNTPIDLCSYKGEMEGVAFEITSRDSYVAGIADRILENNAPLKNRELNTLYNPFLVDGHYWIFAESRKVDLDSYPELLHLATVLETLRRKCLEFITMS